MTLPYPITLPGPSTFRLRPGVQVVQSEGDLGPISVRRRSRQPTADAQVTFRFLEEDYRVFVAWWRDDLLSGHKWFTIPIPSAQGVVNHVIRFASKFTATKIGFRGMEVSADVELRERQIDAAIVLPPPPDIVLAFKQIGTGSSVIVPTHLAGDFLVLVARGTSGTVPDLPSGWTNALAMVTPIGNSFRVMSRIDAAGSISSITVADGTQLFGVIYRNASAAGAVSSGAEHLGTSHATPPLTLTGVSRIFTGMSTNQLSTSATDPASHTRLWDNISPNLGGGTIVAWDTVPSGVTYAGSTSANHTNGYAYAWSLEVLR